MYATRRRRTDGLGRNKTTLAAVSVAEHRERPPRHRDRFYVWKGNGTAADVYVRTGNQSAFRPQSIQYPSTVRPKWFVTRPPRVSLRCTVFVCVCVRTYIRTFVVRRRFRFFTRVSKNNNNYNGLHYYYKRIISRWCARECFPIRFCFCFRPSAIRPAPP